MVKKILLIGMLLLFAISYISAFCNSQGYVLDKDKNYVNASRINIICHRAEGNLMYSQLDTFAYGFPFGNWYDDCSYCDLGIEVNIFEDSMNLYGGYFNQSCAAEIDTCHSNIYMNEISEPVSSKQGYSSVPDLGPLAEEPMKMPPSNATPEEKLPSVRKSLHPDYTVYYVIGGIILLIIIILIIRKYVK